MRVSHAFVAEFDDDDLLTDLVKDHVSVPGSAGSKAEIKVPALVAGMIAGADSISDMDLLRHGGMGRAFTEGRAPTTLGTYLRAYTHGHTRQLGAVASRLLPNLRVCQTGNRVWIQRCEGLERPDRHRLHTGGSPGDRRGSYRELARSASGQSHGDGGGEPVVVIRLDATVIQAASAKEGAGANYKGWGFHPLTGWCSNTGENLAVMNRPGSAGSFTAADHVAVVDAALEQVPAGHRRDVLITTDGAGASHEFIDHLEALNTAAGHGGRGRRVEYSIGWALDERTTEAIAATTKSE